MGIDADFGLEADMDFEVIGRCVWIQRPPPDNWPRTQLEELGRVAKGLVMVTNVHAMKACNDDSQLLANKAGAGGTITSPRGMK